MTNGSIFVLTDVIAMFFVRSAGNKVYGMQLRLKSYHLTPGVVKTIMILKVVYTGHSERDVPLLRFTHLFQ